MRPSRAIFRAYALLALLALAPLPLASLERDEFLARAKEAAAFFLEASSQVDGIELIGGPFQEADYSAEIALADHRFVALRYSDRPGPFHPVFEVMGDADERTTNKLSLPLFHGEFKVTGQLSTNDLNEILHAAASSAILRTNVDLIYVKSRTNIIRQQVHCVPISRIEVRSTNLVIVRGTSLFSWNPFFEDIHQRQAIDDRPRLEKDRAYAALTHLKPVQLIAESSIPTAEILYLLSLGPVPALSSVSASTESLHVNQGHFARLGSDYTCYFRKIDGKWSLESRVLVMTTWRGDMVTRELFPLAPTPSNQEIRTAISHTQFRGDFTNEEKNAVMSTVLRIPLLRESMLKLQVFRKGNTVLARNARESFHYVLKFNGKIWTINKFGGTGHRVPIESYEWLFKMLNL